MVAHNLRQLHDDLVQIAYKAGEMITSAHPSTAGSGSKKNCKNIHAHEVADATDLVTETDKAVEAFVSSSLQEKYPDFSFMGEETYKPGEILTAAPTFIVDPIDGTTNFVHGYPYVSISLGVAIDTQPVVGVVYNPFTQTLYSAVTGQGAYKNLADKLPKPGRDPIESLDAAQVAIEWGSDRSGDDFALKTRVFSRLAASNENGGKMVHSLRSFGSAALNLCAVAEGHIDAYWEGGCWAWDVCAGMVILAEAGGRVLDGNPAENVHQTAQVDGRRYLGVRAGASDGFVQEFWDVIGQEGRLSYSA